MGSKKAPSSPSGKSGDSKPARSCAHDMFLQNGISHYSGNIHSENSYGDQVKFRRSWRPLEYRYSLSTAHALKRVRQIAGKGRQVSFTAKGN